MQASRADQDDGLALVDRDLPVALPILVSQLALQRGDDVADPLVDVRPGVGDRILEVEHDTRRPRVEHLHDQLGVVGGTRHLVALILTPARERDPPAAGGRLRGREIVGQPSLVGRLEHLPASGRELPLPR